MLILASQRINYGAESSAAATDGERDPDRKELRGPPPTPVEWTILVWVFGLIWVEIKQLWNSGLYDYCTDLWNILDFITNALYLCTFVLRLVAYLQASNSKRITQLML
ncbi:unnamed protein product [Gongylonema pulchrum]|uniref:Ion transport domain-containing protein n=1 Tax=Gongylonema pulchrum TaxID=637853 RepID=A0A3P7NJ77_9BILA|nr:unnamed protein product [Gongylonema pulchrum]